MVIDGQQRLLTLKSFHDGIIRDRAFALVGVSKDFAGKTYKTLADEERRELDDSILHATIFQQDRPSDDRSSIYSVFERLNTGGTSLQPQEIRSCVYRGAFNDLLSELANNSHWRKLYFGGAVCRRGLPDRLHRQVALGSSGVGAVPESERYGYRDWLASNLLELTSDAYATTMYDERGAAARLPGYRVDAVADAAIRCLDRQARQRQPFFLFTSFLEPHMQNSRDDYPAPTGYEEACTGVWVPPDLAALGGSSHRHLAGYYGMVKRLDEALGRVLDALRSLDLLQSTVVLFTSDHGCHFKTRNDEYKRSCHESSIRLPTVLIGPGLDGGGRVRQLTSLIDLPRTLLDAAGLTPPPAMRGRSVLPLLTDPAARKTWPDDLFVQVSESQVGRALRTARWKYGVFAPGADGNTQPSAASYQEQYLYDLRADRYELVNLAGSRAHDSVAARLRRRLLRHLAAVEGSEPTIVPAASRHVPLVTITNDELAGL